jgi:hypothetical protein
MKTASPPHDLQGLGHQSGRTGQLGSAVYRPSQLEESLGWSRARTRMGGCGGVRVAQISCRQLTRPWQIGVARKEGVRSARVPGGRIVSG